MLAIKSFFISIILWCAALSINAQDSSVIGFSFSQERLGRQEVQLIITARVLKPGTDLYTLAKKADDAVFSQVIFDSAATKYLEGNLQENGNIHTKTDSALTLGVSYVNDSLQWIQKLNVPDTDTALIKGKIAYMYRTGDQFPAEEKEFRVVIMPDKRPQVSAAVAGSADGSSESLWWIFLAAFGGGLLALITPCVYSMIPVTVSFFTKRSKTKAEGIRNALYYSLSIIVIFTLLGFLITAVFGPDALNKLATNWIANIIFFLVFLIFGISFLGAFEIELPAKWSTAADSRANTKNFWGIFFMALTLVVVSFSCTGPIIGNLLVLASKGNRLGPLTGMFGFSLALSLPFALFAFFPSKLNMLGKAGGWLNAVKVTLGFLELALALKFLSNADLTQGWRLLDREVFLVLWIALFFLLGIYLLGKLKFKHDDELPKNDFGLPYLSVTRLFFAIASFAFMIYLIPGLWGAPLKGLSAFLPPMGTQDFNADDLPQGYNLNSAPFSGKTDAGTLNVLPEPRRFADVMKKYEPSVVVNNGLITYFDYEEALAVARKVKRPLMLDFTGVNCVNCRLMEGAVWSDPEVMKRLKNDFVVASLFTDIHTGVSLPLSEQYYSPGLGKQVETLGERNSDLQVSRYGSLVQPLYFFLDQDEKLLAPKGYPYIPSVPRFIAHLDKVIAEYKKRQ